MPTDMSRMVMCVPNKDCLFTHPSNIKSRCCWLPKGEAETNENYRQVIPYCAVAHEGKYLSYSRDGAESRLHGLRSIGVGGHIENGETLVEGFYREMKEEVGINLDDMISTKYLGLIIESNSAVDKVHIGLMYSVTVSRFEIGEELACHRWETVKELNSTNSELEPWSQILLDEITNPF